MRILINVRTISCKLYYYYARIQFRPSTLILPSFRNAANRLVVLSYFCLSVLLCQEYKLFNIKTIGRYIYLLLYISTTDSTKMTAMPAA